MLWNFNIDVNFEKRVVINVIIIVLCSRTLGPDNIMFNNIKKDKKEMSKPKLDFHNSTSMSSN